MNIQAVASKEYLASNSFIGKKADRFFYKAKLFFKDGIFPCTWDLLSRSRRYWLQAKKLEPLTRSQGEHFLMSLREVVSWDLPLIEISCARVVCFIQLLKASARLENCARKVELSHRLKPRQCQRVRHQSITALFIQVLWEDHTKVALVKITVISLRCLMLSIHSFVVLNLALDCYEMRDLELLTMEKANAIRKKAHDELFINGYYIVSELIQHGGNCEKLFAQKLQGIQKSLPFKIPDEVTERIRTVLAGLDTMHQITKKVGNASQKTGIVTGASKLRSWLVNTWASLVNAT